MKYTVFTKPWRTLTIPELARKVSAMGFEGVELPVRPGFQVSPDNMAAGLPEAVRILADFNLRIESIAGPTDERSIAACAAAGIPIIRICVNIGPEGYTAATNTLLEEWDQRVILLQQHGVTLGIQNHCGASICHATGLRDILKHYDPHEIAAVWDAAHNALNGEEPEQALEIIWPYICMVNLKNAFWKRTNGPEALAAEWRPYWTTGRHGLASWPRVAHELKQHQYEGVICLTAEYSEDRSVDRLVTEDLAFARSLLEVSSEEGNS